MRWTLPLLVLLSAAAHAQAPAPGEIVVNEILYDPPAPQPSGNEWVEVLNRSDRAVDLTGVALADAAGTSDPVAGSVILQPGEFAVLVRDADAFEAAYPGVPYVALTRFPALNNGGDTVALQLDGEVLDSVPYTSSWGGSDASLERRDPDGPSDAAPNFGTTTNPAGGTPGATNSLFTTDEEPPSLLEAEALSATSVLVTFDEPVEASTAEVAANYAIDGGIGAPTSATVSDDPAQVLLQLATALASPTTYGLTVSGVADPAGNVLQTGEVDFFYGEGSAAAPRDLVVNEILYAEPSDDNPGEYVELFNRTDRSFDLRDFTLNDAVGADTPVTDRPVFVEPSGYAVVVEDGDLFKSVYPDVPYIEQPSWSALNNTGDAVVLRYRGALVDSLTYVPSWGGSGVALERKDPEGPSSVAANWASSTDPRGGTPGAQNSQFAPDLTGPLLVSAAPTRDGRGLTVTVDEPLDPASVRASAFTIEDGPAVSAAQYDEGDLTVTLDLAAALPAGNSTVSAGGLADLLGNTTDASSTTVTFTPDTVLPTLVRAQATSATAVRVEFSEPVTAASAADVSIYAFDGGVGRPTAVTTEPSTGGGVEAAVLTLGMPLADRQQYTVTASGLADLAGNVQPSTSASLFFGQPDTPGSGDLVLTEIMYDPQNGSAGEYIEVLNTTEDRVFDLQRVTLDDGSGPGAPLAESQALVFPGDYVAVVRSAAGFAEVFEGVASVDAGRAVSLSNTGEAVVLRSEGAVLDSVFYSPAWHRAELDDATGIALERRGATAPSSTAAESWSSSLDERGGTPSAPNTLRLAGTPVERESGVTVTSPFAPGLGEAAEITYTLGAEAALIRARIYDGSGRLVRELEPGRLSGSTATLTWDGTGDDRQRLRAGIYVVLIEAVDVEGGTVEARRAALVLARP